MRFAVSLLTVLGIASILGTVLKQNEAYNNYIVQFGTVLVLSFLNCLVCLMFTIACGLYRFWFF